MFLKAITSFMYCWVFLREVQKYLDFIWNVPALLSEIDRICQYFSTPIVSYLKSAGISLRTVTFFLCDVTPVDTVLH